MLELQRQIRKLIKIAQFYGLKERNTYKYGHNKNRKVLFYYSSTVSEVSSMDSWKLGSSQIRQFHLI